MPEQVVKCPECHTPNPSDSVFCNKCGTQFGLEKNVSISFTKTLLSPGEELTKGNTLAERYEIVEELGEGGMGFVYKVFDTKIKEDVALKVLKSEVAAHKDTITRFRNELKYARRITHKNVCRMHDINEAAGTNFITMEYVEGETLKSVIKRMGKLKLGNVLSIALQVTDGLAEAHSLGIVHRDLKPQNIMIDKKGNAKIMDFGIARFVAGKGPTVEGMVIGTPEYMSPEQVEGKKADSRSDIYALGVIFYEMVTGKVPFSGESAFSVALKHKSEKPADPRKVNPQLPEGMARAILRCMEKNRNMRYQSAGELLAVLMAVEEMLPEKERVAKKIVPRIAAGKAGKSRLQKLLVPALVSSTIVLAGIAGWLLLSPTQTAIPGTPDRSRVAVLPLKNMSRDKQLDYLSESLSTTLANDLRQTKYFSVSESDQVISALERLKLSDVESFSQENLRDFASETAATHIIKGTYIKFGDIYRVDISLLDAGTLEVVAGLNEDGAGENALFAMVDNLTKKLKPHFNLTNEEIAEDLDGNISDVTTPNLRALQFYTEAEKALNSRDFNEAIESLQNAILLDPDFAMAYRLLSGCYNRLYLEVDRDEYYWSKLEEYRKEAFEAARRRPPSESERLFIEASNQNTVENINTLFRLVELYPDDEKGNETLGIRFKQAEEYELAKRYLETLVRNNSGSHLTYFHLSDIYGAQGLYDEARKIVERSLEKFPGNPMNYLRVASVSIMERDFDTALSWCQKGYELDPNVFTNYGVTGDARFFMGDFSAAEAEYRKLLNSESEQHRRNGILNLIDVYKAQGRFDEVLKQAEEALQKQGEASYAYLIHSELAHANITKGKFEEALRQCEQLRDPYPLRRLFSLGELFSEMQLWQKVEEVVSELEKMFEKTMQEHLNRNFPELIKNSVPLGAVRVKRCSLRLQGLIEIWRGNYDLAIDHLKQAKSLFRDLHDQDFAYFVEPLALAYFEKGDLAKAIEEYEAIGLMTYGRKDFGDIHAKSFYMLGIVYEQLGKKRDAIKNYERFLELWKNADPGLPEVDDAKARLIALK